MHVRHRSKNPVIPVKMEKITAEIGEVAESCIFLCALRVLCGSLHKSVLIYSFMLEYAVCGSLHKSVLIYSFMVEYAACNGMVKLDSTTPKQIPKHNNIHIPIEHYNTQT